MADHKKKPIVIILIVIVALVFLCGSCGVVGFFLFSRNKDVNSSDGFFDTLRNAFTSDNSGSNGGEYGDLEGSIYISQIYNLQGEGDQEVKIFGNFRNTTYIPDTFEVSYGDSSVSVYYQNMDSKGLTDIEISSFSDGDPVVVEGVYDMESWTFYGTSVKLTTEEDIEEYKLSLIPNLEIEILDYPNSVAHVCKNFNIKVKLTNTGKIPVTYKDLYDSDYSYTHAFRYSLNGGETTSYYAYDAIDETEIFMGLEDFDVIEPGESVEVIYQAGGNVTESIDPTWIDDDGSPHVVGIAGEMNILYNNTTSSAVQGDNELQFHWVQVYDPNDYSVSYSSPIIQNSSEKITIKLLSTECDMDDIQDSYTIQY